MINSSMAKFFTVFEKNYYAVQGSFRADRSKKISKKIDCSCMALPKIDFFFQILAHCGIDQTMRMIMRMGMWNLANSMQDQSKEYIKNHS